MNIKFKKTPAQVELIKAIGSRDPAVSRPAMEMFAAFLGPIVSKVLTQAGSASMVYKDESYDEDDSPSIPLDLYADKAENHVQVWQQNAAGGLPTSLVTGFQEMKLSTYTLDSAVSFLKKYARKARLGVLEAAIKRMTQEVLVKQERNAWAVLLKALAEASTNTLSHIITANSTFFQLDDLNKLFTRIRRINTSFLGSAGGTPADFDSRGLTDLFLSPKKKEAVRAFAYHPMNPRAVPNTDESTAVPLPDSIREQIFRNAGAEELYGVSLHELLELGTTRRYTVLFDTYYTSTFNSATDDLIVGVDLTRDSCIRPVATNADTGATFQVQPDDQFLTRQDKSGFFGSLEEGRVVVDARALVGIRIANA